jgi:hypothetical protein
VFKENAVGADQLAAGFAEKFKVFVQMDHAGGGSGVGVQVEVDLRLS